MAANPTETLDPQNFVSYYNLPCIFITPAGTTAATDAAAVQALADALVTKARQYGFKRTECVGPLDCRMLSDTLAVLSGVLRRFDSSDQLILSSASRMSCSLSTTDGRSSLWRRMRA